MLHLWVHRGCTAVLSRGMAYVVPRENNKGVITSYQVKWRAGGTRTGRPQCESFDDEQPAEIFKDAVNEHGQHWPPGWVKGRGYITADGQADIDDERYRFRAFAMTSIRNRTGAEDRYKDASIKELERYIFPTFGECDVRSTEHFSRDTVAAWVEQMKRTWVWRGSKHKPMSPKTLKNLHGLLSSILKEAVDAEPPLRARNPCEKTSLPRTDDQGVDDDAGDDHEYLTPQEVDGIVTCLPRPEDQRLVRVAYGTGMRWGEVTALSPRMILEPESPKSRVRVARAWKRGPSGDYVLGLPEDEDAEDGERAAYYLGKPKTRSSRRTLRISPSVVVALTGQGLGTLDANDLLFHNGSGRRLPYSTFYDRWQKAVQAAKEAGLLPAHKRPGFHDLRHSHVAALISAGHGLPYVQRRLGHESYDTTARIYGHLLPEADDDAMETVEQSLGGRAGRRLRAVS
jgi:integrase